MHVEIIKALIAAQVAALEYEQGNPIAPHVAKAALIKHLNAALVMAEKLKG